MTSASTALASRCLTRGEPLLTLGEVSTTLLLASLAETGVWLLIAAAAMTAVGLFGRWARPTNERRAADDSASESARAWAAWRAGNDRFGVTAAKVVAPLLLIAGVTLIVVDLVR
jgi:hypothetical protein